LKRCTKCRHRFPATHEHFYLVSIATGYLRAICKRCSRKAHRKYMREHPRKNREYNQHDYGKHRPKRIADEMKRYRAIKNDPRRYAIYLKQRLAAHNRRMRNSEYAARRREQQAAWDAKRIRVR
jgi:hypothetical protein